MFLSLKTSSAMTVGWVDVMEQESRPLLPSESIASWVSADSMSAEVVPGAKLEARTWKGPALPFMLRPLPGVRLVMLTVSELRAVARRFWRSRVEKDDVDEGREGGLGRWAVMEV
jgi:hypothetical protein